MFVLFGQRFLVNRNDRDYFWRNGHTYLLPENVETSPVLVEATAEGIKVNVPEHGERIFLDESFTANAIREALSY